MNNTNTQKILFSFGRISKQWGLGESVGKVWGFLLFKSKPITQKEIEKGMGYSRGLVSRSLNKLKELDMINIIKKGKEFYYSTDASLIKGFNKIIENFLKKEIKPLIKYLFKVLNKIKDITVKKNVNRIIKEYRKLNTGITIFSKIMNSVALLDLENLKEIAKKYSTKEKERE